MVVISSNDDVLFDAGRLEDVCGLFDSFYIANTLTQMNKHYIAISSVIFSDGGYHKDAHKDGYIHITDIDGASYIIFINTNKELYLAVYKYASESTLADIEIKAKEIRTKMSELFGGDDSNHDGIPDDSPINIRDPKCPFCNNALQLCGNVIGGVLVYSTRCNHCNKGFTLEPAEKYLITTVTNYGKKGSNSKHEVKFIER